MNCLLVSPEAVVHPPAENRVLAGSAEAARLVEVLTTASKHSAALCFIDTAPHGESPALAAARAADLVLIPCRPSILDLRAITASQTIAQLADTPAAVVLYGAPASGSLAKEAQTALQTHGLPVAPVRIGRLRTAYACPKCSGAWR